ncbi:DNA polymerase III subunit psi [Parashewanella tropica]|uniref:DNA polymerase III subunit psi n=1 Tax=Parashewanella tropica TaxID=2547970 RepID=UPI001059A0EF|nr:DNA polymerase III subunit psi [Parashewanella tropica]
MDKSAFLDAMNIQQWQSAANAQSQAAYLILHDDDDTPPTVEFVAQILRLLDLSEVEFAFAEQPIKGAQVIWDMRQRKTRPHTALIESAPMAQLLQQSQSKRELWQQICQHLNQLDARA